MEPNTIHINEIKFLIGLTLLDMKISIRIREKLELGAMQRFIENRQQEWCE